MSNNDGFWNVNLGNLKDPSSGTVFNHGIGQQLLIQISSPPDVSFHYSQTITGDSPQKIILPKLGIVTLDLSAGWNMIGSVSQVVDFSDPADNPDQSILPGTLYEWNSTGFTYRPSTHIEPGRGYWVLTLQDCQLTVGYGVD